MWTLLCSSADIFVTEERIARAEEEVLDFGFGEWLS